MLKSIFAATAALALLAAGTAFAAEPASATPPALKDGMFVTASGMTLSTFDKDATPGKSVVKFDNVALIAPVLAVPGAGRLNWKVS